MCASTETITIGIKIDEQHEFRISVGDKDLSCRASIPFSSNLLRSFLIFVTVMLMVVTASSKKRLVDWRTRVVGFIKFRMSNLAS